jgi:predicted nucleic acid-binding protein
MIVDANIATYWCVETPFSRPALSVAERMDLRAPSILKVETANALLKYLRAGLITRGQFSDSFDIVDDAVDEFVDDSSLLRAAAEIAVSHSHKVYDCLYLALAVERRESLVTVDRRLAAIAVTVGIEVELIQPGPSP